MHLIDTPGFMVGPEVEQTAQVRHVSRLFVTAAHLRVPFFSVVLRKGYGLGAMGMAAGGFHAPVFTIAWPTGEFGAMGLEGAVRLGFRKELEALPEGPERDALFFEAKRLTAAWMPYKLRTHPMQIALTHPWLIGHRRPLFWANWFETVDLEPRGGRG